MNAGEFIACPPILHASDLVLRDTVWGNAHYCMRSGLQSGDFCTMDAIARVAFADTAVCGVVCGDNAVC